MPEVSGAQSANKSEIEFLEERRLLSGGAWISHYPLPPVTEADTALSVVHIAKPASSRSHRLRAPAIPSNLVATVQTSSRIMLTWTDNATNETNYVVERALSTSGPFVTLAVLPLNSTAFLDRRALAGNSYAYRVHAAIGTLASAPSNIATASTGKTVTTSGPIVITRGGVYSGNWTSNNPNIPAVQIETDDPVIIQNSIIHSRGTLIQAYGNAENVTVQNVTGYGMNPNVAGDYVGHFLDVDGFASITVQNCSMIGTAGIYLYNYQGDHSASQTVKILRNSATNIDGRVSDGAGGWLNVAANPDNYRQFFQVNGISGLSGAEVAYNQVINQQGQSRVEESINISTSSGTRRSPFLIHDNYIQGAFPANSVDAVDYTGGGIMASDNGSAYISVFNNEIVATGGIGIEISSGHDNAIYNNRIIASGIGPNGSPLTFSNVGAVIWNFNNEATFTNNVGYGNVLGWVNGSGDRNDAWVPDAARWTGNSSLADPITPATETAEFNLWLQKLSNANVTVGSAT